MNAAQTNSSTSTPDPMVDPTRPDSIPPLPDEALHEVGEESIDVAVWAGDAKRQLDSVVREHPYASVAAAAGIGYVLGGGLPSWALRLAVQAGTRVAVSALVASVVADPTSS